jgi:hypothetical protein
VNENRALSGARTIKQEREADGARAGQSFSGSFSSSGRGNFTLREGTTVEMACL